MSLKELTIIEVYNGLSLETKRELLSKLLESAQVVSYIIPTVDQIFAKFIGKEFMHITFDIYNKMYYIWLHLKKNTIGATRIRNNQNLIIWNKPDENYKETNNAIVYKDQNMQYFLEDGHPRGLLICFNKNEISNLMEVFHSKDPKTFLEKIGWE